MEHFEDIKRLRELQNGLQQASEALGKAIVELSEAKAILAIKQGVVADLSQRKSTMEEGIRVEKIAIQNLPQ